MKEFGWTIEEVLELKIPTFRRLLMMMYKDAKKGKKKIKTKR